MEKIAFEKQLETSNTEKKISEVKRTVLLFNSQKRK
jgi:hypothetical protein